MILKRNKITDCGLAKDSTFACARLLHEFASFAGPCMHSEVPMAFCNGIKTWICPFETTGDNARLLTDNPMNDFRIAEFQGEQCRYDVLKKMGAFESR